MTRTRVFLTAVDLLQSGRNISIEGERYSGRTFCLNRVRDHFFAIGWRVIWVSGVEALQRSPFSALALTDSGSAQDLRSLPIQWVAQTLGEQVSPRRTVVLVDDGEWLDESSWSALSMLSLQHKVPIALVRTRHTQGGNGNLPTGGLEPFFTLQLPPMAYAELENTLEQTLSEKVDPTTMSRVYSKAAGNIGIAIALVEAAGRNGQLKLLEGGLRAVDTLWSPSLSAIAAGFLRALDGDEVSALRALSLLGPAPLRTASDLVPEQMIYNLEMKQFIEVLDTHDEPLLSVVPPIVAEYFRHEPAPGRRADVLARIEPARKPAPRVGASSEASPRDDALFVRLTHERARRLTHAARNAWRRHPSQGTAAALISALSADSASSDRERDSLLVEAEKLDGSPRERVEWAIARARYEAGSAGVSAASVTRLSALAAELPTAAPFIHAEAAVLEIMYGSVPESDPVADLEAFGQNGDLVESVAVARSLWLVAVGRFADAHSLLDTCVTLGATDKRFRYVQVYALLGLGEYSAAREIADAEVKAARAEFNGPRLQTSEYLRALCLLMSRQFALAEAAVDSANALGIPHHIDPSTRLGVAILSGFFAVQRGQRAQALKRIAELDAAGVADGPLPGLHRSLVHARVALLDEDRPSAGRASREAGDELWARGARFAAAVSYLDGQRVFPDSAEWERARPRVTQVEGPAVGRRVEFIDALVAGDPSASLAVVTGVLRDGEIADASEFARIAVNAFGTAATDKDTLTALEEIASIEPRPSALGALELTSRELEVAEFIASGLTNPMIADVLVLSVRTVESHVNRLMKKIGVRSRADVREFLLGSATA